MARVFLSSTRGDLDDHRTAVNVALQQLGHVVVSMETYVSESVTPLAKVLSDVASCDAYVCILAWRYGSSPPNERRSFTELEFRTALEHELPRFIFLLDEDAPWLKKYIDRDTSSIDDLRAELERDYLTSFFSSPDELATLVSVSVSNWMSNRSIGMPGMPELSAAVVAEYALRLQQQYGGLDLDALTPPEREEYLQIQLQAVFVEPSVREEPPPVELPKELWEKLQAEGEIQEDDLPVGFELADLKKAQTAYQARPIRQVLDVLAQDDGHHAVVLGDPGAGKSTLARYLALSVLAADPGGRMAPLHGHLPLLIELRTYARLRAQRKVETFLEFLAYIAEADGFPFTAAELEKFLQAGGRALVIFDGLDELFDPADREDAAKRIAGFAAVYPAARVLVTSRIVGYRRGILTNAGFVHYTLQDLTDAQIAEFLHTWYQLAFHGRAEDAQDRRARLLDAMNTSRSIRELAGNPMLLTILAIMGKGQELPRERWKLYDHAANVLVQHWDVNKHLQDERVQADFIAEDDKKELLRRVANRMQAAPAGLAGNHLTAPTLQREFEAYLRDRYQRDPASAKTIAATMIRQFRERNFILSRYGAGVYGFVHRAFLEFFCADYYVQQFEKLRELSLAELERRVFAAHWADPSWREVLRLITGRVAERFAGELIRFLSHDAYRRWPAQFKDRPPRNVALAVQCLGEVRSPNAVRDAATDLLQVVIRLLTHSIGRQDRQRDALLQDELLPAVEAVGLDWPDRERYEVWYRDVGTTYTQPPVANVCAAIAAALLADRPAVRDLLFDLARTGADYRQRVAAVEGIARGWAVDPAARALLSERATGDKHRLVRQAALVAVREIRPTDPQTLSLVAALATRDPSKDVRQQGVLALTDGWPTEHRALEWLGNIAIDDADDDVRQAARSSLRSNPATRAFLADRLQDPEKSVREAALALVAGVWPDGPESIPMLVEVASGDAEPSIRQAAVIALGRACPDGTEALRLVRDLAAGHADERIRQAAATAVGHSDARDSTVLALLCQLAAGDADRAVRRAAVIAIGNSRPDDPQAVQQLRGLAVGDAGDPLREAALNAIGRSNDYEPAVHALLRSFASSDPEPAVRKAAVIAIGHRAGHEPKVVPLLRRLAAGNSAADVRLAAVVAMAHSSWIDPKVLPLMTTLAAGDADPMIRHTATIVVGDAAPYAAGDFRMLLDLATGDAVEPARWAAVSAVANAGGGFSSLPGGRVTRELPVAIRQAAVLAMGSGRVEDPDALRSLRDVAVPDLEAVVDATAGRPDELLRHLASHDPEVAIRQAAVVALGPDQRDPDVLGLLCELAARDREVSVRLAAVAALGRVPSGNREVLPVLRGLMAEDHDLTVRSAAAAAIAGHLSDDEAVQLLRDVITGRGAVAVRQAVVTALGHNWHYHYHSEWLLIIALNSSDPIVRRAAVNVLGKSRIDPFFMPSPAFREYGLDVRRAAFTSIGDSQPLNAHRLLRELATEDSDVGVRQAAVAALGRHEFDNRETRHFLRELTAHDTEVADRQAAVLALGTSGSHDPEVLSLLCELAGGDTEPVVRQAAVTAVRSNDIFDPDVAPLLRELAAHDPAACVRRAAALAVVHQRSGGWPSVPTGYTDSGEPEELHELAVAIGGIRTRDPEALAALRGLATDDPDREIREAATSAVRISTSWAIPEAGTSGSVRQ